jgi:branched-chain amino acid aminotransferase
MKRSAQGIFLDLPCSLEELHQMVLELAKASKKDWGLIRLLAGRGLGGFGVDPLDVDGPSLYMIAYSYHKRPEEFFEMGASACRASIQAKPAYLGKIKTVNYLPNVLMKREATLNGCDFPVCFDEKNFLAEGAVENICLVDESGTLILPNFDLVLPGTSIMRGAELIRDEIPVSYRPVSEEEMYRAKEILAVGTTLDAVGVVRYNNRAIGTGKPGPVAKKMRKLLQRDFQENGVRF